MSPTGAVAARAGGWSGWRRCHGDRLGLSVGPHIRSGQAAASSGAPKASEGAAAGAGPVRAGSIRDVNPLGGTQNCVNCVIAGDATLSGSRASALNAVGPPVVVIVRHGVVQVVALFALICLSVAICAGVIAVPWRASMSCANRAGIKPRRRRRASKKSSEQVWPDMRWWG